MLAKIRMLVQSGAARDSASLVVWQGVSMAGSLGLTALIARGLDVADYGTYRYALTFLTLGATLLQVGIPYSIARLLALESDAQAQRAIIGVGLVAVCATTVLGMLLTVVFVTAARNANWASLELLAWVSPALFITLGQLMVSSACQGMGRIGALATQQVLPYLILLPATALQIFVLDQYSTSAALGGYVLTFTLVLALGFQRLGLGFDGMPAAWRAMRRELALTGFPIYVGGVFGVASAQFVSIWTASFVPDDEYGQYALALAVAAPLGVLLSSIGTVIFRRSTKWRRLPGAVIAMTVSLAAVLLVAFLISTEWFLVPMFGAKFAPAVPLAQWLSLGAIAIGCGDVLQRYLGANGLGRALGVASVLTGVVGSGTAALLLPRLQVTGAVASSILSSLTYFFALTALYMWHVRRRGSTDV
jgi:O-antigen/teichoic acid export membrane protein